MDLGCLDLGRAEQKKSFRKVQGQGFCSVQVRARRAEAMAPLGVLAHSRMCPGQGFSGEMRFAVWTGRVCTGRAKHVLSGTRMDSYECMYDTIPYLAAAMLDGAKKETIGFVGGACSAERAPMT